jgi:thiol-disulfide isomerase/thioredoxin
MVRKVSFAIALLTACFYLSAGAQEKAGEVTLQVVKYKGLKEAVLKHQGKVVLVDFWGDFCPPCKAAFPHTVELHNKFESKGLAVISVALDSLEDEPAEVQGKVKRFLQKQKATFTNLLLDEPAEFWQAKFRMKEGGPPCIYVFSRQGKWTQLYGKEDLEPARLDRLVEELLAEK